MAKKRIEDMVGVKSDGREEKAIGRPDMVHTTDRQGLPCAVDRPDMSYVAGGPDAQESEKRSDLKQMKKARGEPNDLQAERGGLKVRDSDFETK